MEGLSKTVGWLAGLFGLVLTLVSIWSLRWLVPQVHIKKLRDELDYVLRRLNDKETELVSFRRDRETDVARLKLLNEKIANLDERSITERAYAYGLERYVKKLEALCLKHGESLPPRE